MSDRELLFVNPAVCPLICPWLSVDSLILWRAHKYHLTGDAQDELYLKDPAVIVCVRGWSLLAEGYRLNVALSLHAIQMVSASPHVPKVALLACVNSSASASSCISGCSCLRRHRAEIGQL